MEPAIIVVQLVHIQGPLKGQIQELSEATISIGRHPSCLLRFPPDLTIISRRHADIVREGSRFKLIDHSTNGTFLNGQRVQEAYLRSGDVLAFGEGGPKVSFLTQVKESLPPESKPVTAEPERPIPAAPDAFPSPRRKADPVAEYVPISEAKVPLVIQYGPTLQSFKILPIIIGSNPQCDFHLEHPAIQARHAQIFFSRNQYWIKDLTGQKDMQIDGRPIEDQMPMGPNCRIALSLQGPVFQFIGEGRLIEVQESPAVAPTPSETMEDNRAQTNEHPPEAGPSKSVWSAFKRFLDK